MCHIKSSSPLKSQNLKFFPSHKLLTNIICGAARTVSLQWSRKGLTSLERVEPLNFDRPSCFQWKKMAAEPGSPSLTSFPVWVQPLCSGVMSSLPPFEGHWIFHKAHNLLISSWLWNRPGCGGAALYPGPPCAGILHKSLRLFPCL